jgi:hypothetical protein
VTADEIGMIAIPARREAYTPSWALRELVTDTGQIIADSPSVATVEACLKTLKWLRTNIEDLPIVNAEGNPIA